MVKKAQKPKVTRTKPSTSIKKKSSKVKDEKLSNGFKDSKENEKAENKDEKKMIISSKEVDKLQDDQSETPADNVTDIRKPGTSAEMKNASALEKKDKSSQKRKIAESVKNKTESSKATRVKRQKVFIEIPKINPVSGKVFGIGSNELGQLGFKEDIKRKKKPALLDLPHSIADIAAGAMHSVCLTENGEVITFGCNDEGVLGRITTDDEELEFTPLTVDIPEKIVKISAGDSHSAALSESGHVYIWGNFRNNNGPMGLITEGTKQYTPVRILNDVTVVQIASGSDHLTCLSQEGDVYTCGNAEVGQLGRVIEKSSVDGGRRGIISLLTPDKVPLPRLTRTIDKIWTAPHSTFMRNQENGLIYAFGVNNYEQLGIENPLLENPNESPKPIFKPKEVTSFSNKKWLQLHGGLNHTLALDDNGLVFSLGYSEYGLLGLGKNCGNKSKPTAISSLQDEKCVDISCGNRVSFAVTGAGSAFSWGMGTNHQLGHGDDDDQHLPKLIEGDEFKSWKAIKVSGGGLHTLILAQPKKTLDKSK